MTDKDDTLPLVDRWLAKARDDLDVAARTLEPPPYLYIAAFHCQQAVEKSLKAYLTWRNHSFAKTHNLLALVESCEAYDADFRQLRPIAESLNPYASETRYPDSELILDESAALHALEMASSALNFIVARLPSDAEG